MWCRWRNGFVAARLAGIVRESTWSETERLVSQLEQALEESDTLSSSASMDSMELG